MKTQHPAEQWKYLPHEDGCPVVGPQGRICDLACNHYPDDADDAEMEALDAEQDRKGYLIASAPLLQQRLAEALAMLEDFTSLEDALQPFRDALEHAKGPTE